MTTTKFPGYQTVDTASSHTEACVSSWQPSLTISRAEAISSLLYAYFQIYFWFVGHQHAICKLLMNLHDITPNFASPI